MTSVLEFSNWYSLPLFSSVMLMTYLLMIPFLSSSTGGCQVIRSVLESRGVALRFSGGAVGATEYNKIENVVIIQVI